MNVCLRCKNEDKPKFYKIQRFFNKKPLFKSYIIISKKVRLENSITFFTLRLFLKKQISGRDVMQNCFYLFTSSCSKKLWLCTVEFHNQKYLKIFKISNFLLVIYSNNTTQDCMICWSLRKEIKYFQNWTNLL